MTQAAERKTDNDYLNQASSHELTNVASTPNWLTEFINTYQALSTDNLELIEQIYHDNVVFEDPLHRVVGLPALNSYFEQLYTNVISCQFIVTDYFYQQEQAAVYWQMSFRHNKLNGGNTIEVSGHSKLKVQDDKVIYHRDYLDAGAMLYEHIPMLGSLVKLVKARAAQ